jgi:hypothetical protein
MAKGIPYSDKSDPSLVSVEAFRALVDRVNLLSNMTVNSGQLIVTEGNVVLDIYNQGSTGGSGVPTGYEETAVTIKIGSECVTGSILFKPD